MSCGKDFSKFLLSVPLGTGSELFVAAAYSFRTLSKASMAAGTAIRFGILGGLFLLVIL